jgi:hypothetical protein
MTLSDALPVPLVLPLPVSVKFSTFAPRVNVTALCTSSLPSFAFSVTVSPALSTMNVSSPAPPDIVSAPAPPSITLLPALPTMTLFDVFPVPLRFALPVSVRFSRVAPSV